MSDDGATIELDDDQRETANEILERLADGGVEHPEDVVDTWESVYERYDYDRIRNHVFENVEHELVRKHRRVPVSKVAGAIHRDTNLKEHRLRNVLNLLLNGDYQEEPQRPPKLEKIADEYYISVDGTHRITAFKALEIEEIYVEFIEIPLP